MRRPHTDKITFAAMASIAMVCVTVVIVTGQTQHLGALGQLITTIFGLYMAWKVQPPQEGTTIVAHVDEPLPSMKSAQNLLNEVRTSQSQQNMPKFDLPTVDTGSGRTASEAVPVPISSAPITPPILPPPLKKP